MRETGTPTHYNRRAQSVNERSHALKQKTWELLESIPRRLSENDLHKDTSLHIWCIVTSVTISAKYTRAEARSYRDPKVTLGPWVTPQAKKIILTSSMYP